MLYSESELVEMGWTPGQITELLRGPDLIPFADSVNDSFYRKERVDAVDRYRLLRTPSEIKKIRQINDNQYRDEFVQLRNGTWTLALYGATITRERLELETDYWYKHIAIEKDVEDYSLEFRTLVYLFRLFNSRYFTLIEKGGWTPDAEYVSHSAKGIEKYYPSPEDKSKRKVGKKQTQIGKAEK